MSREVKRKQQNSKMCLVCGLENRFGLRAAFYELEGDELVAVFRPTEEHQGYPSRLHGGIASAILDETMGRAIMIEYNDGLWWVTVDLNVRFKRAIPLDQELRVVGRITKDGNRFFESSGEIVLEDGTVAPALESGFVRCFEQGKDLFARQEIWKLAFTLWASDRIERVVLAELFTNEVAIKRAQRGKLSIDRCLRA